MHETIFNTESWKIWEDHFSKISENNKEILLILKGAIKKINFSSDL